MIFGITQKEIITFILVLARVGTAIALFPVFSSMSIPALAKVGASVFLTLLIMPLLTLNNVPPASNTDAVLLALGKEAIVGLLLGFLTSFLFAAIELAGQLIAIQMGFAMANVMDPLTQNQSTVISQFYTLLSIMIFLLLDGHHFLLSGLCQSFAAVPLTSAHFGAEISKVNVKMMSTLFISATKIGAPVIVALLIASIALGLVSRAVPQMNVFLVGIPLNIGLGLAVIAYSLPLFTIVFRDMFMQFKTDFLTVIKLLMP